MSACRHRTAKCTCVHFLYRNIYLHICTIPPTYTTERDPKTEQKQTLCCCDWPQSLVTDCMLNKAYAHMHAGNALFVDRRPLKLHCLWMSLRSECIAHWLKQQNTTTSANHGVNVYATSKRAPWQTYLHLECAKVHAYILCKCIADRWGSVVGVNGSSAGCSC